MERKDEEKSLMDQFINEPWVDPQLSKSFERYTTYTIVGIGVCSAFFGFAIGLRKNSPKSKTPENIKFALKAFGYGTGLCFASSTVITLGVMYIMDVRSFKQFAEKMRKIIHS